MGDRCRDCGEEYDECGSCDAMLCGCEFESHECDFDDDELGLDPEEPAPRRRSRLDDRMYPGEILED